MSDVDDGKILKLFVDGDCLNFNSQKIQSFCLNWEEEKKMATIFKISPQIYFVSLLKKINCSGLFDDLLTITLMKNKNNKKYIIILKRKGPAVKINKIVINNWIFFSF